VADPELPIPVIEEKGGDETESAKRFDWRWIDLRKDDKSIILKVWTEFERGFRDYFNENDYIQIYTPSFMGTSSETGAEVFEVKYFDKKAYLAQSPQFYKQMAMASGLEKVFTFGPVFRAEPSFTTRHLTEFTGFDFEISYIKDHYDIMNEEEKMIVKSFERIKRMNIDIDIPSIPFPKLTMEEAKKKLSENKVSGGKPYDLTSEEETVLSQIIKKETGNDFVFVTNWPIEGRPFYHMRFEDNKSLTKSFDLLYKGLEVTTGAQREHRPDILIQQAKEKGMDIEPLNDYINFFRYGCPPHGGAGIGPARFIMKILNLASVKEATFLPRDVKRLRP
jgi:aspartyl-tRNA synthetase